MNELATYWFITLAVIFILVIVIGRVIQESAFGILIDSRKKMSLSRFQLSIWSWLIISTFFAIVLTFRTMNIELRPEVWALMGISLGSAAGSIIVKGTKKAKKPDSNKMPQNSIKPGDIGLLHKADKPHFSDMFKGEEILDHEYVDIAKVQMFFFSLAAFIGYGLALWSADISISNGTINFPPISKSLVTIIGISHTGYLTVKAAPKTPFVP